MSAPKQGWRSFLADIAVFGIAFGFTSVISYLYVVVAGRTLATDEFGIFNALLGLITLSGFFASSVQLAATKAGARSPDRAALIALLRETVRTTGPATAFLTIVAMLFAFVIAATPGQLAFCGVIVFAAIVGCSALGFLAGIGRIRGQAIVSLIGAVARIASGWPMMLAHLGVMGALAGSFVNYLVVLLLAALLGWRIAGAAPAGDARTPPLQLDMVAISTFVLAFVPFSLDQVLVQSYTPELGSTYAAAATAAKLVFFSAYPVTAVVYPHLLRSSDLRSRLRLLAVAMGAVTVIAFGLGGLLAAFPEQATTLLFGDRFPDAADHLGVLALGVACFAVSTLAVHALIVCGSRWNVLPSVAALGLGLVLFTANHDTLGAIVENQLCIYGLQMVLVVGLLALAIARAVKDDALAMSGRLSMNERTVGRGYSNKG